MRPSRRECSEMLSLGIDTSTKVGCLAIVRDGKCMIEKTIDAELDHSARLLPTLESALEATGFSQNDIGCIGVGTGPGSLTGVRVGIAFAKGLVFASPKPLVGVCSLEAVAYRAGERAGIVTVIVDAKLGGYYCAGYRWTGERFEEVRSPSVWSVRELPVQIPAGSLLVSPDERGIPKEVLEALPPDCRVEKSPIYPSAEYIARRAPTMAILPSFYASNIVEPIYLRPGVPQKAKLA